MVVTSSGTELGRRVKGTGENLAVSLRIMFILAFLPSEKNPEHLESDDSRSRKCKIPGGILLNLTIFKTSVYFSEAELWSFSV